MTSIKTREGIKKLLLANFAILVLRNFIKKRVKFNFFIVSLFSIVACGKLDLSSTAIKECVDGGLI
jgi:hypothetical protein